MIFTVISLAEAPAAALARLLHLYFLTVVKAMDILMSG